MTPETIATILGGIAVAVFTLAIIGIRMTHRQLEPDRFSGDQGIESGDVP